MKTRILLITLIACALTANAQIFHINENFDSLNLPTGWSNTAVSGTNSWSFGLNGASIHIGNQNINGTGIAYFDDDALGSGSLNNTASLSTPTFNNATANQTTLEFDYNFRSASGVTDSFYVDVWNGSSWNRVFERNFNDCGSWISITCIGNYPHAVVDISTYANANCQVRFSYHDGNDWGWYVGFDNVEIYSPAVNDLQVAEIISPVTLCGLDSTETVTVKIKNLGVDTASNFNVVFDVDGGTQVLNGVISSPLVAGDSMNYTFSNTVNLSQVQNYSIKTYTDYTIDAVRSNDTVIATIANLFGFNLPFIDDFEGANHWSVSGTSPSWALGMPTGSVIFSAYSGLNSYVTNLSGNYNNNEVSYLTSPCLNFSNGLGDPILSFRMNYSTEFQFDFIDVEYSINDGVSWHLVQPSPSFSLNWYPNSGAWDGNSNGWIQVQNTLTGLAGEANVKIRFRFRSDGSTALEGVAIDDVSIIHPLNKDASISRIISPIGNQNCGLGISNVVVEVVNQGLTTIDTVEVNFQINGGTIFTDTIIDTIPPFSAYVHRFNRFVNFTNITSGNVTSWVNLGGDLNAINDTVSGQYTVNAGATAQNTPFVEDFETFTVGASQANGWVATPATGGFVYRWRADDSGTPSFGTGPVDDHTPGLGVNYLYTEASVGLGGTAIIESPCVDLLYLNNPVLDFWYHKFGGGMGTLYVDVFDGSNWINGVDVIPGQTQANQADPYILRTVNLSAFAGQRIKVAFRASGYTTFQSDIAIDDIKIFENLTQDVSLEEILFPNPIEDKCFTTNTQIIVHLENVGSANILPNDLKLYYQVDNNPPVVDSLGLTLPPGVDTTFIFSTPANFSTVGSTYNLRCWTQLSGDSNFGNDSLVANPFTNQLITPPYIENFDGPAFVDGACNTFVGDIIGNGWTVSQTDFTWNLQNALNCVGANGATPSLVTGPMGDNTTGNGQFFYTECNPINGTVANGDVAWIISPCIDFTTDSNASISFWYHKYGGQMGALHVDVQANGIWTNGVAIINGQTQTTFADPWLKQIVDISNWAAGNLVQIRFRGFRTNGIQGDMAIDDIEFFEPIANDARVDRLLSPSSDCRPNDTISIQITNAGSTAITTPFLVGYRVNGGTIVRGLVNTTIGIGQTYNYTFPIPSNFSQNNTTFNIEAWTELPNDSNVFNDTVFVSIINTSQSMGYVEDFESFIDGGGCLNTTQAHIGDILMKDWKEISLGTYHWVVQDSNCMGTPSAGTGPAGDHTFGNGTFIYAEASGASGTAVLESPCIDLSGHTSASMEFWYHRYGTNMGDLIIEVFNNGIWISGFYTVSGQNQFSNTDPWIMATVNLNQFAGNEIIVRFRGNYGGGFEGDMAIDDIRFYNPLATVVDDIEVTITNFNIYPNPSKGQFNVDIPKSLMNERYQIYDLQGRLIQEGRLSQTHNQLELSAVEKGVYLIRFIDSNVSEKLIIN